jgi:hypothetical protein
MRPLIHSFLLLAGCLWPLLGIAQATVEGGFRIERVEHDDWEVAGLRLTFASAGPRRVSVSVTIDRLDLAAVPAPFEGLSLECEAISGDTGWDCAAGVLRARDSAVGAQTARWTGSWRHDGGGRLEVDDLRVADGALALTAEMGLGQWSLEVRSRRLVLAPLAALVPEAALPDDWGLQGAVSGRVGLTGSSSVEGGAAERIDADLVVDQFGYSSPDGRQAAEGIIVRADVAARAEASGWRFDGVLRWPAGALYSDPLYIDAAEAPLTIEAGGRLGQALSTLEVEGAQVALGGAFALSASGAFDLAAGRRQSLTLAAHSRDAAQAHALLLQPFLIGTPADDMVVDGQVGFVLHLDDAGLSRAGLSLAGLSLTDRQQRFALASTDGSVAWQRAGGETVSTLRTAGIELLGIRSEPFEARARFVGDQIELLEPLVIPLLDGELALDAFHLDGALVAGSPPRWRASASLRELSLERLTAALDWPPFEGSLSASLSDMRYAEQVLSVGGGLELAAFGGAIRVEDLRLRDPLGSVPVLSADARLRGLDLDALTRTFSFGRIQGRLDGDLDDLRLVAWRPDRFDLHLYTPEEDPGRRRISQRAVENLTELGSGLPGGLSASFLGIFEEFAYRAIDARVRLDGDVAEIDGLARDDGGYYLVRGSGLPRIDVIGRNRRVAWKDLVERLRQIQVEGARIE